MGEQAASLRGYKEEVDGVPLMKVTRGSGSRWNGWEGISKKDVGWLMKLRRGNESRWKG